MTPAHEVAEAITTAVPALALGTNLFVGAELLPHKAGQKLVCFVSNDTFVDGQSFAEGNSRKRLDQSIVRLFLRGEKDDPRTGLSIAGFLADMLDQTAPGTLLDVRVQGSGVNGFFDEDGFPCWTVNLRVSRYSPRLPLFIGAAVAGTIDAAFIEALPSLSLTWRTALSPVTMTTGKTLYVALPVDWDSSAAFPLRVSDGLDSLTALATTRTAPIDLVVRGATVPYAVHAAALAAGAHTVKVI